MDHAFTLILALLVAASPYAAPGLPGRPMFVSAQLDEAGLSDAAFRVLGRIYRRWTPERGCYEAKASMVDSIPMSKDRLYAALDELDRRRFIVRSGRGAGARIDPLPPSEWLAEEEAARDENVRETQTNRMSGNPGQTQGECLDNPDKLCPENPDLRMSGNPGHKGDPPKGIHEGDFLATTTTPDGQEGAPPMVVVEDGGEEPEEVDPDRDAKNRAWALLRDRDVADAVALAAEHWAVVPQAVEVYDRKLATGEVSGPGWLTGALRRGFRHESPTPARQAATRRGPLPEAVNPVALAHSIAEGPVASPETVAGAMDDWRQAAAAIAARRESEPRRKRHPVRAADLAPDTEA